MELKDASLRAAHSPVQSPPAVDTERRGSFRATASFPCSIAHSHELQAGPRDRIGRETPRAARRSDLRRPFEELRRPVPHREVFGIAFVDAHAHAREQIARYTHAVQLTKLRSRQNP
jgi:hypothetical protein